jgi:hypothetical protein
MLEMQMNRQEVMPLHSYCEVYGTCGDTKVISPQDFFQNFLESQKSPAPLGAGLCFEIGMLKDRTIQ